MGLRAPKIVARKGSAAPGMGNRQPIDTEMYHRRWHRPAALGRVAVYHRSHATPPKIRAPMVTDLVSLAIIALIAFACPILCRLIPNKAVPETVLLLAAGTC